MKILHVITTLAQGGAEAVLFRLIVASTPALEHVVISMRGDAYYAPKLRAAGIAVHTLSMPRGRMTLSGLSTLRRLIIDAPGRTTSPINTTAGANALMSASTPPTGAS